MLTVSHCDLEKELFGQIEENTPEYVKNNTLFDISNKNEFVFVLKKEYLQKYDKDKNPLGLGLWDWFENYSKVAKASTAGIRGPQNILYPHDTRFPINTLGIMLATLAKALVLNSQPSVKKEKVLGREVRYNSDIFLEIIARIQAAQNILTHVSVNGDTIPIWLASFLAFKLDLAGGEYITSSHGISVKNATKDLNNQGSQYLPDESMAFVNKIREIFEETEKNGEYRITFAAKDNKNISDELMKEIENGIKLYVEYLQNGVATEDNIAAIKAIKNKIYIEAVGGCAYKTLSKILKKFGMENSYEWLHIEEDPFFHSIGKSEYTPKGERKFYDYSVDATVTAKDKDGNTFMPVIKSLHYEKLLNNAPVGTAVLITDPDHDRLTVTQIEPKNRIEFLKSIGVDYVELNDDRILCVYTANQAFLMLMDFWAKSLKASDTFNDYPRFVIKTTASALSWDEWAKNNGIKVVNVPVGFKEIANILKKVEAKLDNGDDIVITDVFGEKINLGKNPRLVFAGEESGGMIIGPNTPIKSLGGRTALAMREKSATEAIFVASALLANLEKKNEYLSDNLFNVFNDNNINGKFDIRKDISYYNESESDIEKLKADMKNGEGLRTKNDLFYLTLAVCKSQGIISLSEVKNILQDAFKELDFSDLEDIKFVGDGTYLSFSNKFIEIRPSGTDAKTKAYGGGLDKNELIKYTNILGTYSGDLTELYKKIVSADYYNTAKEKAVKIYEDWTLEP